MKERDEIEDLFASSFGDFEETPPEAVKSNLDAKLFPSSPVSSAKKWNWKWLLVFIPVIGLSAITFYKLQANTTSKSAKNSATVSSKNEYHKSSKVSNISNKTARLNNSKNTKNKSLTERNKPNQNSNIQKDNERKNIKNNLKSTENLEINPKVNNKAKMKENTRTYSLTKSTKERNSTSSLQAENSNKKEDSVFKNELTNSQNEQESNRKTNVNSPIENIANNSTNTENNTSNSIDDQTSTSENKTESSIIKTENNSNDNTANDSLKATTEIVKEKEDSSKITSTKNNEVLSEVKKDNTQKNKTLWSISFYGGIANGINIINPTSTLLKEKIGSNFSLEANYGFHPKMSVSTGLGLELRNENYSKEFINIDSVVSNYTVTYITDSMNNIIDSIVTNFYENDTTLLTENQAISYTAFSIPIYLNYTFFTKNNWSGAIGAGIRLNYFKTTINSTSANFATPSLSKIGLQLQLRPQLTYNWSKLGVGLYGNFGYDVIQATSWTDFTRKRYNYGAGIIVKYGF
jgi:hypothetical protein